MIVDYATYGRLRPVDPLGEPLPLHDAPEALLPIGGATSETPALGLFEVFRTCRVAEPDAV
ncbi:hypothetical protein REMIM1_PE00308 (plasmid) [Rhizobium etli bv. mimosae str. Mim1]|nr:hypothetical protein REMIM1_PE00308 [Rhizobium etli bv. mimosae str. Mim1]